MTVTQSKNEFTHNVQERGRQEAVTDSEHRLLYMRNAAVTYEDSRPVMQTLMHTQHSASVATAMVDGSQPLLACAP